MAVLDFVFVDMGKFCVDIRWRYVDIALKIVDSMKRIVGTW